MNCSRFLRFLCSAAAAAVTLCSGMSVSAIPDDSGLNREYGEDGAFYWEIRSEDPFTDLKDLITIEHHSDDDYDGAFSCEWDWMRPGYFVSIAKGKLFPSNVDALSVPVCAIVDAEVKGSDADYWGLHGWLEKPSAEFFIVQDYEIWRPPGYLPSSRIGDIIAYGIRYEVYRLKKQSSTPFGAQETYWQYWIVQGVEESVKRRDICITSYLQALSALDQEIGRLYNTEFFIDIIMGSGSAKINRLEMFRSMISAPSFSVYKNGNVSNTPDPIPGDVDGDEEVTETDAAMMVSFLLGETLETDEYMPSKEVMDISEDGTVNAIDLTLLKRYLLT